MAARMRSPSKVAPAAAVENYDEEDDDASTACSGDYVKSSDCILLDGLCDQYLGGQRQYRHSRDYYNPRYFKVEDLVWPAAPEETVTSLSSYRSSFSVASSAPTADSNCSTPRSSRSSTKISL
eukprot:TRINITY_DN30549_c0_g2_i1.p2 TRINITY_DN30549_c0_g2~~TRINITY_DN30549_c0_g2_i1.p2  ORF type:complete len:137 (+),score=31.55 TRINITY_DN30549_c0_g2_i1:45-413(+)